MKLATVIYRLATALVLLGVFVAPLSAHTYHATLSDIKLNRHTDQLEVIHRFFADDIAQAISQPSQQKIRFADALTASEEVMLQAYINRHFKLFNEQGTLLPLRWVGAELETHYLYVYQEQDARTNGDYTGYQLHNSLLFNSQFQHQVNTVNLMLDGLSGSLIFTEERTRQPLSKHQTAD